MALNNLDPNCEGYTQHEPYWNELSEHSDHVSWQWIERSYLQDESKSFYGFTPLEPPVSVIPKY